MIGAVVVSLLVECTLVMSRAPNYDDYETDDYEGRIWRGNHTTHEKHPYFAAIVAGTGQEDYLCGGAFVTSEMVITAGHCVFGKIPSRVTIKYGINELYGTPGKQMKAQAIYIHPKFDNKFTSSNPNMLPDIALVKLKGSIDDKAMLINLPEPGEDENYVNRWSSTLVAMGASFNGEKNYDLKAVRTKLILSPRCWPHTDTKLTVCAFGDYSGYRTCPGQLCPADAFIFSHRSIILLFQVTQALR